VRGGRRHSRGWAQGPQFPGPWNTGAKATAVTSVNISGGATSGTSWSWDGTTCTVTGSVTGLNVAGPIVITGANAVVSNCVADPASSGITAGASGVIVDTCTAPSILFNTAGLSDITVQNCTVRQAAGEGVEMNISPGPGVNGLTIQDCTISGLDAGTGRVSYAIDDNRGNTTGLLIQRCDISWCRVGANIANGTIQDCYIHDFGYIHGDHTDGVTNGGTNGAALSFIHNTILMAQPETSPLTLGSSSGNLQNVTIAGNLLAGGDYCAYLGLQGGDDLRTDTGCTISGGTTLTDGNLVAGDAGCTVTGTGIPPFTTIGTPSGTTAVLSQACTNGTADVTLHYTSGIVVSGNRFSQMFYANAGTFAPAVDYDAAVASNSWDLGNVFHDTGATAPS
jgi:hypothetical protein